LNDAVARRDRRLVDWVGVFMNALSLLAVCVYARWGKERPGNDIVVTIAAAKSDTAVCTDQV